MAINYNNNSIYGNTNLPYNTNNQMAKVFNQQDLIDAGAAKKGMLGFSLNDKGKALEKFRENATKMNNPTGTFQEYKGLGVQSQFDRLLQNKQKNEMNNKEFIQEQINKGWLQNNPSDFNNQGNLNDLDARLTPGEEYLNRNPNLTASANNIGRDFTYDRKPTTMETFQSIFQNADTGRYNTNPNTFDYGNMNSIPSSRGGQNYGIPSAPQNLKEEEIFNPTQYSALNDIENRNKGVPQDSRFSGIMKNAARGPLFQGGANLGAMLSGGNPLFALAGGIGSQFLNLDNRPSNLDYSYVNQPGGISLNDNKIQDPDNILSGLNFASGYGSNNLGTMYENFISKMDEREEESKAKGRTLTAKQIGKRQVAKNRLEDYLYGGAMIPGTDMTRNQFANDYNKGIGQFATPDYDKLMAQDQQRFEETGTGYQGGENTASAQETGNYDDTYDPGYAD